MSEYTPITGELRNSMTYDITTAPNGVRTASIDSSAFCDLCDAIDSVHAALEAEHEKAMIRAGQLLNDAEKERDYNYANWQECKQKVLQGNITFEELERENESLKAELDRARGEWDFWESTHVELPKDADGEYICAGDKLDGYGKTIEVVELRYGRSGWVLISRDGNAYADTFAFTHHHAPTVEDVLREMADRCYADEDEPRDRDAIVAEYAKRLTLAGDAE